MNAGGRAAVGDQPLDLGDRVDRVTVGVDTPVLAPEAVGRLHGVHPIGPGGKGVRIVGDRRRNGVGGIRPPVVGLADRDDIASAGGGHRQPQRQIACLRTGVHQEHRVQRFGQHGGEPLAELHHRLVVEARVGVQPAQLTGRGVGDPWMGVAQNRDVVDHVEVGPAVRRHQEVPPAALDLRRLGVVVLLHRREAFVAPCQQIVVAVRFGDVGKTQHRARVTAERKPASREFRSGEVRRGRRTDGPHTRFGPSARRRYRRDHRLRVAGHPVPRKG